MQKVYYRIVTENFADEPGQRWPVEVLIQTEDPADFDSFEAASGELLDRIQERIDREEDKDEPDHGYLDKLNEKLGDSQAEDWEEYCYCVSQPEVFLEKGADYERINVAEVAGRKRMRRLMKRGVGFKNYDLWSLRRLERQAAVGKKVVKVKRKKLKPRVRPALKFDCVRIDPRLAEHLPDDLIRGLLAKHRRSYERHDWHPRREGFTSLIGQHGRPDVAFYCFTVFFDREKSITFATLVGDGETPPDDQSVMERATVEFTFNESVVSVPPDSWHPEFN